MLRIVTILLVTCSCLLTAADLDKSLVESAKKSVVKAAAYLTEKQNENGSWGPYGGMPEFTALACTALMTSSEADKVQVKAALSQAEGYILKHANQDGSIWRKSDRGYPNYSTSVCIVALYLMDSAKHKSTILKGREWLKGTQLTAKNAENSADAGGIGYGKGKKVADLSNTQMVLEALYLTREIEKEGDSIRDLKTTLESFKMADEFLSRCQALPETNDQKWARNVNGDDVGGFIYSSDRIKTEKDGKKSNHNVYGSMTYAGLKSMIYTGYMKDDKLNKDDPRVKAAVGWASKNYSVDKNPGVGTSGLYYYLQTFAKAMKAYGEDSLKDASGKDRFWRVDLINKLISTQQAEGYWVNENGRWMENVPVMVTAFALTSINQALN